MNSNSAAFQQLRKLEISEPEDSDDVKDISDELQDIIFSLHSTMFSAKYIKSSFIPDNSSITDSLNYLRYLVDSLSKAFSYTQDPVPQDQFDSSSSFNSLKKMMRAPSDGVYLKQSECREICSLLVGDIRDVEYNCLKEKLMDCQQKLVKYSKTIAENRIRIEEREKELEDLYDYIDLLNDEIKRSIIPGFRSKLSGESTNTSINIIWND